MNTSSSSSSCYLPKTVFELVQQLQLIPHPEGGYFRETYRSGCIPMSSRGRTAITTDANDNTDMTTEDTTTTTCHTIRSLVQTTPPIAAASTSDEAAAAATETAVSRNAITSIYWVPTIQSPKLLLAVNLSDHIHYYQGSSSNQYAFVYYIYNPITNKIRIEILGPNIIFGQHQLQVCVKGGEWKCGHLISAHVRYDDYYTNIIQNGIVVDDDNNDDDTSVQIPDLPYPQQQPSSSASMDDNSNDEYMIIGEAVGPGFDIEDFRWITPNDMMSTTTTTMDIPKSIQRLLQQYIHTDGNTIAIQKDVHFDQHYNATATATTTSTNSTATVTE